MKENERLTKNFMRSEFACKCGCGKNNISLALVNRLQRVRNLLGEWILTTSGCRCLKWNKHEGGSPTSAHLDGLACDIALRNSQHRYLLVCALLNAGFQRIGLGEGFVHVDVDYNRPTPSMFLYSKE